MDILIGSTQMSEGFAIRDYARRHPGVTFVNGSAAGQDLTLDDPAPNFFRFTPDGAQFLAGLGAYAYDELGWRNVVTVANDEGFSYTQVAGFVAEFCALGGNVVRRIWTPLTAQDYAPSLAQVPPEGVDGFLMAGFTGETLAFANRVPMLRGTLARRVVLGIFSGEIQDYRRERKRFAGVMFGNPIPALAGSSRVPEQNAWNRYAADFRRAFPEYAGFVDGVFAIFYRNDMEAVLDALESVNGDLSGGQRRFQAALADTELDAPNGHISLDARRQAVVTTYLQRVVAGPGGQLRKRTFRSVPHVEQTFGGYFDPNDASPGRAHPQCKHGNPPAWAHS